MTTIIFEPSKHSYNAATKTFSMSERFVPGFDTTYTIMNPATLKTMRFDFKESTGPEFDPNTKWIYKSLEGITLEICNDAAMTKAAANAYLDHKLNREERYAERYA